LYNPNDVTYIVPNSYDYWVWDQDLPEALPIYNIYDPTGYKYNSHVSHDETRHTHYVTRTYLKNLDGSLTQNKYGACFRPDVEGQYEVVLHLSPGGINCYYDASAPLTITASCNTAPTLTLTVPSTGNEGERMEFTANAADSDGDGINYIWNVYNRITGYPYTDHLTNRHGKDASAILDEGDYTITCQVSDGCSTTSSSQDFSVVCPNTELVLPKIDNEKFSYDGIGTMPMTLDVTPLEDGRIQHYTWYLVDFSPIGWDNGINANFPAIALLLLALIVMWF
jgi:hypothetical protein